MLKFTNEFTLLLQTLSTEDKAALLEEIVLYDTAIDASNERFPTLSRLGLYNPSTQRIERFIRVLKDPNLRVKKHRSLPRNISSTPRPVSQKEINEVLYPPVTDHDSKTTCGAGHEFSGNLKNEQILSVRAHYNHFSKRYQMRDVDVKDEVRRLTNVARKLKVDEDLAEFCKELISCSRQFFGADLSKEENVSRVAYSLKHFKELFMKIEKINEDDAQDKAIELYKKFVRYSFDEQKIGMYTQKMDSKFTLNLAWILNKAFNPVHMSTLINRLS